MILLSDICDIVARRIGIRLRRNQLQDLIEGFVSARVRELGFTTPQEYVRFLAEQSPQGEEFARLISVVTNLHTYFFRNSPQLLALRTLLLQWPQQGSRPLSIWSAGCATGEEPYSLAMICADVGVNARILGTDVNREALEIGKEALYRKWSLRYLPPAYRKRFLEKKEGNHYICARIKSCVDLKYHNLVGGAFPMPGSTFPMTGGGAAGWDIIFCRNVLLYFDSLTVQKVLLSFSTSIAPGGWLFLGPSEYIHTLQSRFRAVCLQDSFGCRLQSIKPELLVPLHDPPTAMPMLRELPVPPPDPPTALPVQPEELIGHDVATTDDYQRAIKMIENDDLAGGCKSLDEILAADPEHVLARVTLGNLLLRTHAFERAVATYREAQERAPLLPEIHFLEGLVYRKLGDLKRAVIAFRRALFLQPRFWYASFLLAGVYSRLDNRELSMRNLRITLSCITGSDPLPAFFLSHVKGMRDVELERGEVIEICKRALSEHSLGQEQIKERAR